MIGQGVKGSPLRVDLPSYASIDSDPGTRLALVDVPDVDVPPSVAAFVAAYPIADLTAPLPAPFPPALATAWKEHLARRYDLGNARWSPEVA